MLIFNSAEEILNYGSKRIGVSDWLEMTQHRVNFFADAVGDHQWIHVDADKAEKGPFGACIAHGYLTLSLCSLFRSSLYDVKAKMAINYGVNQVRFPAPVKVGENISGTVDMVSATKNTDGSIQVIVKVVIEIENQPKPACIAEIVSRYYF
jgi:acyl dehydratase